MRFSVPIVNFGHPQFPNAACFSDYVQAVVAALRDLGHEVVPPTLDDPSVTGKAKLGGNTDRSARPIVFGAQNMLTVDWPGDPGSFCPPDAILYNSEQTGARGADPKRIFDAVKTWHKRVLWDYSETNAAVLRAMGCERVIHCPVAYHPVMTRIEPLLPEKEDIDVLFYGSIEPPNRIAGLAKAGIKIMDRGRLLMDCKRAGLKVENVFGVYGRDLDKFVARAKVVVNLHYYEGAVFEIFRCSQLLANKKCVVTEDGGADGDLEAFARRSMLYVSRKDFVETCKAMVGDANARRAQGERGFEEFKKTSLVDNVRRALEQS